MNMKKTLVLAAVLLVAFLYMKKYAIPSHERGLKKDVVFADLKPTDLDRIRIERVELAAAPPEVYELRSLGEQLSKATTPQPDEDEEGDGASGQATTTKLSWEYVQIPGAAIDQSTVDTMVSTLTALDVGSPIQDDQLERDFSAYGLDKPTLTLSVQRKGGEQVEVAFGKRNEYLLKRYVKVSGRAGVFLVDDGSFAALNKGARDVRSKAPIQINEGDIRSAELVSPRGAVKLNQVAVGEWKIVSPSQLAASTLLVGELLRSVRDLRVVEFIDTAEPQLARYGLDKPAVRLSLTLKDAPSLKENSVPQSLEVLISEIQAAGAGDTQQGASSKEVYFKLSNVATIFKTGIDSLDKFSKGEDDLRERRLLKLNADEIEKVQSTGKGITPVEIVATNTDWNVNGKRSDPSFVEQLLNDISAIEALEFPTQVAADAFSEIFLSLTVTKKGATQEKVLITIGKEATSKAGAARWARIGDDGMPVLISELEAKRLVPHEEALIEVVPTPEATGVATPKP